MRLRQRFQRFLRRHFGYKHIGWRHIDEHFTRYTLFECRWFRVYLHKLTAPKSDGLTHDHPWHFWALILWGGYWEIERCGRRVWRGPLSLLYRTARFHHSVVTPPGTTNWSICLMSRRKRDWKFFHCDPANPANRPRNLSSGSHRPS